MVWTNNMEKKQGWGLYSTRLIAEGEFIGHYAGQVVDLGCQKRFTGVLQDVVVCCRVLQRVAVCCSVLQ